MQFAQRYFRFAWAKTGYLLCNGKKIVHINLSRFPANLSGKLATYETRPPRGNKFSMITPADVTG